MEVTAVILYKDAFAYYSVLQNAQDSFTAHLVSYSGAGNCAPPAFIQMSERAHVEGNTDEALLMEDILRATKLEQQRKQTLQSFPRKAECFLPLMNRWF